MLISFDAPGRPEEVLAHVSADLVEEDWIADSPLTSEQGWIHQNFRSPRSPLSIRIEWHSAPGFPPPPRGANQEYVYTIHVGTLVSE